MAYAIRADIEAIYGADNVEKWADLNGNEVPGEITARIAVSIAKAEEEINNRLRYSAYTVPWTVAPVGIVTMAATFAGFWLYESRGITDFDADGEAADQLGHKRKQFDMRIRDILGGRYTPEAIPLTVGMSPSFHEYDT